MAAIKFVITDEQTKKQASSFDLTVKKVGQYCCDRVVMSKTKLPVARKWGVKYCGREYHSEGVVYHKYTFTRDALNRFVKSEYIKNNDIHILVDKR
jgi:hypothetical protein